MLSGLKSSEFIIDLDIYLKIFWATERYSIRLFVNDNDVYNEVLDFNKFTSQENITLMLNKMSAEILVQIKKHI
jgi:hypothetical protein